MAYQQRRLLTQQFFVCFKAKAFSLYAERSIFSSHNNLIGIQPF